MRYRSASREVNSIRWKALLLIFATIKKKAFLTKTSNYNFMVVYDSSQGYLYGSLKSLCILPFNHLTKTKSFIVSFTH